MRIRFPWIISPGRDLAFLIGGTLAGYLLLTLYAGLHVDVVKVWFVWFIVLDSPHFFATYVRTVFDKETRRVRGALLRRSLACFLVGPAVLLICLALYRLHVPRHDAPFLGLVAVVNVWAYTHVVRQHYGLLALYKRKSGDHAAIDRAIDSALLYVGLFAPVVGFVLRNHETRATLGLSAPAAPAEWIAQAVALAAVAVVALVFVGRQAWRAFRHEPINGAKVLFFAAVIPLHVVASYHPAVVGAPLLAFVAMVTIHHDIQYLAIVWFYEKNRCHGRDRKDADFGLAARLTANWRVYLGCAILQGVVLAFASCALGITPGCIPLVPTTQLGLFGVLTVRDLLFTVFLGVLMQHYVVDQFIWRVGKDAGLRRDLLLPTA